MKALMLSLGILGSSLFAETVVVYPSQNYYYSEYQPDNGPMRGPNSLDYYKYGGRNMPRNDGYYSPYSSYGYRNYRPY